MISNFKGFIIEKPYRILRIKKIIFLVLTLLSFNSCAPYIKSYQYISFENAPGINILESSTEPTRNVYSVTPIPILYEIKRDKYVIRINSNQDTTVKIVYFKILDQRKKSLIIKSDFLKINSFKGKISPNLKTKNDQNGLGYNFRYRSEFWENKKEKVLEFDVIDQEKNVIGKERIPFEIRSKGFLFMIDAV